MYATPFTATLSEGRLELHSNDAKIDRANVNRKQGGGTSDMHVSPCRPPTISLLSFHLLLFSTRS